MRYVIPALLLLAGTAWAGDKPNTLTPKEIADGWILLFDGETTFGWTTEGDVAVKDGRVTFGNSRVTRAALTTRFGPEFEIRFDYKCEGQKADMVFEAAARNFHRSGLFADGLWYSYRARVGHRAGHRIIELTHVPIGREGPPSSGESSGTSAPRQLAISFDVPAGTKLSVRSAKLLPLDSKPLFNAKDLTGWKKYTADDKRSKTDFSVTPEGFLHLKSGPGDLQTEKLYDDFILQLECRTNGDRLNSGVFFRAIPGEYQNGYEAQIHNGFDAAKPKEYTVEVYDPKTNELKEKKTAKYSAIDYGTGAIYRRIPARQQAAKDREWFTMTVVAQGRHIATWVNGVQTVDWTDNRPLKDNPRNGCRLEKGAISLQGHDPTTDIDFRNIRIGELPRK